MPTEVATDAGLGTNEDLRQSIMQEDSARLQTEKETRETETTTEETPAASPAATEGQEKIEGKETVAAPAAEDPAKPEAKEEKPKAEAPKITPEGTGWKIGDRKFEKPEDLAAEAERVLGRNANLAGDVKVAEAARTDAEARATAAEAALDKALEHNKAWADFYAGKTEKMPTADPTQIAEAVVGKMTAQQTEQEQKKALKAEVEKVQGLSNYASVESLFTKLSDKVNPLTGKHYTPSEAYRHACLEIGEKNLLTEQPAAPAAVAPKPEEPKPDKTAVRSAAARPAGSGARPAPKATDKNEPDEIDRALDARIGVKTW